MLNKSPVEGDFWANTQAPGGQRSLPSQPKVIYMYAGGVALLVLLVHPYISLFFSRQVDLGFLTGWRGHLKIDRYIPNTLALGPREAQVHYQMFPGALRGDLLHFSLSSALISTVLFPASPFRVRCGVGQAPSKRGVLCR